MPTKTPPTPTYRRHRRSGQAVVTLSGRDFYLGVFGSPESRQKYDRLVAEWLANGRALAPAAEGVSVAELIVAYLKHAETYYLKHGEPTEELNHVRRAMRPLRELFGLTPVAELSPLRLVAVQERFIAADQCRTHVNANVQRVKRCFKWGCSRELVPPNVWHGLTAVEGLKRGRSAARDSAPVRPVPDAFVEATKRHVAPEVAALIDLQRLTGMRSGEAILMRTGDIDMSGDVWCYRPSRHKTEHHGVEREVWLGPKAQDVLRPWLRSNLTEYLFSPRRAVEKLNAARPTHRRQPVRRPKTRRRLGDCYTNDSYRRAISYGTAAANREIERRNAETGGNEPLIPDWHPHQLRHNAATEVRRAFGLEVARAVLGQRTITAAQIYAEMDAAVAKNAALKIG